MENFPIFFEHNFSIFTGYFIYSDYYCTKMKLQITLLCLFFINCILASSSTNDSTKKYKMLLWTEECFDIHFTNYDFLNIVCLKSFISRGLSFGIIGGAAILKVPQMYRFYKAKSTDGVSSIMMYLDVVSFTSPMIYNIMKGHQFFTYGEQTIVLSQNILLILMMWYYDKNNSIGKSIGITFLYAGLIFGLLNAPENIWYTYPLLGAAAASFGRIPQIMDNYKNQYTGTLSPFTFVLNSLGGIARMFTTSQETGDLSILASQATGVFGCLIILFQIFIYWDTTKTRKEKD